MTVTYLEEFERLIGFKLWDEDISDRILIVISDRARAEDDWRMDNFIREASESSNKVVYRDELRRVTFVGAVACES